MAGSKPEVEIGGEVKGFSLPSFYCDAVAMGKSKAIVRLTFLEHRKSLNSELQRAERVDVVMLINAAKELVLQLQTLLSEAKDA